MPFSTRDDGVELVLVGPIGRAASGRAAGRLAPLRRVVKGRLATG